MKPIVAIVDDDPHLLESLQDLLESAGYEARGFSSARSLLGSDAVSEIHCLVTDIGMPEMDGFALQRAFQKRRPDVPVILITGNPALAEPSLSKRNRFFRKPFDSQVFLTAIAEVLS